ncbi:MAG: cysteine--tRNA ligase, partial [Patescibacteria group bacterium]|nr:cysteine--tRNA ligase [Patescibacteria group bacterium]
GFNVKHVMNITDVGHLVSEADEGEDKMEKGAKKFGLSVFEIAKKFENQFKNSIKLLNIKMPDLLLRATEHIKEQIELVEVLEEKGFTYKTTDGIYFDTSKFPDYNKLSRQPLEKIKIGARVGIGEKKNPTDFALWKFSYSNGRSFDFAQDDSASRRQMEWESPWGVGFPGWHIECSAMSMKALGVSFDIHTGGIDHINIHHTNEIAQSEAASGRPFVKYWVHHNFLVVENEKMSKSLQNFYTVEDIVKKGYDPLALRYLYFQTHYRQEMNFTFEALESAQTALNRLREETSSLEKPEASQGEALRGCLKFEQKFKNAIDDDMNMPQALAIVWELLKADYSSSAKAQSLFKFDEILGLNLDQVQSSKLKVQNEEIPKEIMKLVLEREELRKKRRFHLADQLRNKIKKMGYEIEDKNGESEVKKLKS